MVVCYLGCKRCDFVASDGKKVSGTTYFFAEPLINGSGYRPFDKGFFVSDFRRDSVFAVDPLPLNHYEISFDYRGRLVSVDE